VRISGSLVVHVQFLDDPGGVLDDLRVVGRGCLRERLDD